MAEEAGAYLGGQAGMFLPLESEVTGNGFKGKLGYHPGFVLDAALGYRFTRHLRAEGEVNFRRANTDQLTSFGTSRQVDGHVRSYGVMANAYFDFANRTAITPFIGGGAGYMVARLGRGSSGNATLWSADRDGSFAYQGMVGFELALSRQTSLDFVYRHYAVPSLRFDDLSARLRGINLVAGVRRRF